MLLPVYPEPLPRLYQRFWFDRQREYHPGESPIFARLRELGRVEGAVQRAQTIAARVEGEVLDRRAAAIAALLEVFEEDGSRLISTRRGRCSSSTTAPGAQLHRVYRLPRA
jgi:hypothetical protein